jgi:L-ascorbate metabolism protein UlaG (beta-lactamase superfamily)
MYLTWLDNNSWLIELAGQRILLDPWLVGPLVFGNLPWLFTGKHTQPRPIPEAIDLLLLSQGLEDHAHPETLKHLDRSIPVVASPSAAKVVQELGYTQVTVLSHGESFLLADRVRIQAVPGDPIGPFLVENAYILTDHTQNVKLYYDPHGHHSPSLQEFAPVDVVITPLVDLQIPLLGPIIKGGESALQAVKWLNPQVIVPTAAGGDVAFEGALVSVLRAQGSPSDFRRLLDQNNLATRVMEPRPGQRVAVELSSVDR